LFVVAIEKGFCHALMPPQEHFYGLVSGGLTLGIFIWLRQVEKMQMPQAFYAIMAAVPVIAVSVCLT
jgi:hypothetical protein